MDVSNNNAVSYKGTIAELTDFPSTAIRKDGMTYCVNVFDNIFKFFGG